MNADDVVVLEAGRGSRRYWHDLWQYRELFLVLAWRDLAVRYKQTTMGIAWAVVRPLVTLLVFVFVYSRVARLPGVGNVPYPLLVLSGMLPWQLFSGILGEASGSLVNNAHLIGKVYFPRLVIPLATTMVVLVDLAISSGLLLAMMVWYAFVPDWRLILLPPLILLGVLCSLGPALLIAALNVRYRDFRHAVPFMLQCGLYVSPVGYVSNLVPAEWRWLYSLNPLVGVIDATRWSLLAGTTGLYWPGLVSSSVVSLVMLAAGITYFRRTEQTFADHI